MKFIVPDHHLSKYCTDTQIDHTILLQRPFTRIILQKETRGVSK